MTGRPRQIGVLRRRCLRLRRLQPHDVIPRRFGYPAQSHFGNQCQSSNECGGSNRVLAVRRALANAVVAQFHDSALRWAVETGQ